MKRALLIFVVFFLLLPGVVNAQGATETNVSTLSEGGKQSQSSELDENRRQAVHEYGVGKDGLELQVSDPKTLRSLYGGAVPALTPLMLQQNTQDLAPKLFVSGHGRICTYENGKLSKEEETGAYTSAPVPELSETLQLSYQLGPILGDKYSYKPNNQGVYDFNQFQPLLIGGDPPPCQASLDGTDMEAVTTSVTSTTGFFQSALSVVFNFLGNLGSLFVQSEGSLASSQTGTYGEAVERYTVAQKKGDVSYLPGDVQTETEKAGGALNTFFPKQIQTYLKDDEKPEGSQENFSFANQPVKTNDFAANLIEQAAVKTGCMLFPKELQAKFFEAGKCATKVVPPPPGGNCPIDQIASMSNVGGAASCKLCNTTSYGNLISSTERAALPAGVPPLMQKVLEVAGAKYGVPASLLLATMREEGAFNDSLNGGLRWTDENVRAYSDCTVKDPIPECRLRAISSTAKGPFGWLDRWWPSFSEAILESFPTRTKETISECNFVDAAFASAKSIWQDKGHLAGSVPLQCAGVTPYQGNDRPTSCAAWTPERIVLARMQYSDRQCVEGVSRTLNTFNALTCGR